MALGSDIQVFLDQLVANNPRRCENEEEFIAFTQWLRAQSEDARARRKAVYERIGGGAGRATPEIKASFINDICGAYLKAMLLDANAEAADSQRRDIPVSRIPSVARARKQLTLFLEAVNTGIFENQLRACDLTETAAVKIMEDLAKDHSAFAEAILAAAKKAGGEGAARGLVEWIENPANASRFLAKKPILGRLSEEELQMLGRFAPLVEELCSQEGPAQRAEMFAHLLNYAKSGWLERDWSGEAHAADMDERNVGRKDNLARWRDMLMNVDLREAGDAPEAVRSRRQLLATALMARLADLSLKVSVPPKGEGKGIGALGREFSAEEKKVFGGTAAGRGEIDAVMAGPDGSMWACFATSDERLSGQGTQISRHLKSLAEGLAEQRIELPEGYPPALEKIQASMFMPALMTVERGRVRQGRTIKELFKKFSAAGTEGGESFEASVNLVGAIKLMAQNVFAEPSCLAVDEILGVDCVIAGSGAGQGWEDFRAGANGGLGQGSRLERRLKTLTLWTEHLRSVWGQCNAMGFADNLQLLETSGGTGSGGRAVSFIKSLVECGGLLGKISGSEFKKHLQGANEKEKQAARALLGALKKCEAAKRPLKKALDESDAGGSDHNLLDALSRNMHQTAQSAAPAGFAKKPVAKKAMKKKPRR